MRLLARSSSRGLHPTCNKEAKSEEDRLYTQHRTGIVQPPVECAARRAMIGTDSEMQCVASAQAQRMLVYEARRCTELKSRHRHDDKAVRSEPGERRQYFGTVAGRDLSSAQLDRKGG